MKWPNKIRIKARVHYELLWVDSFIGCPDTRGECRFNTKQIVLLKGMSPGETLERFIHEVLHATEHEWDIILPHKSIYALEKAAHKILQLNGWLPKKRKK